MRDTREPQVDDADGRNSLERAIAGALRAAIRDHGPITADKIGSAVKRVIGNLANAGFDSARSIVSAKGGRSRTP